MKNHAIWCALCVLLVSSTATAQNYERYKPLDPTQPSKTLPAPDLDVPSEEAKQPEGDDRILIDRLDAIVIVDVANKIRIDDSIDSLEGVQFDFSARDSIVFQAGARAIYQRYLGKPVSLRSVNSLARDLILYYQKCKQPMVDVQIPEQRITGGTLHLVVVESRIGSVKVKPGCYFSYNELERWIACTRPGMRIYEPNIENDLLWLNQNPFRRVGVDFKKGSLPGTTDVIYSSTDVRPLRGYIGADDTGVKSLNYGRLFAGFTYGNLFGRGGILGYQYTGDDEFSRLQAHALSYTQPLNRSWSAQGNGSWAGVTPQMLPGFDQHGESWQTSAGLVRNIVRSQHENAALTMGVDFKSTNNNLEFSGQRVSDSTADLLQLRLGYNHFLRLIEIDEYAWMDATMFVGPGGGFTTSHNAAAFQSIRPGSSPDYVYGRLRLEESRLLGPNNNWQVVTRMAGQVASERLLFSEMLGLGGFDTLRGFDQRAYNADNGWIANFEFGPRTQRWNTGNDMRVWRNYVFTDFGNGYLNSPLAGEDASTFAMSTGVGTRFQIGNRLIARADYGVGVVDLENVLRSDRLHFGLTWIPGPRP